MIIKQLTGPGKNSDLSNCVAYSDHAIFFLMYLAYAVFFFFYKKASTRLWAPISYFSSTCI